MELEITVFCNHIN